MWTLKRPVVRFGRGRDDLGVGLHPLLLMGASGIRLRWEGRAGGSNASRRRTCGEGKEGKGEKRDEGAACPSHGSAPALSAGSS